MYKLEHYIPQVRIFFHSWHAMCLYTHNISCLTITLHVSLGLYLHPYVSIADAHKSKKYASYCSNGEPRPKIMLEDFRVIIKVSLCTLAILTFHASHVKFKHGICAYIHISYASILCITFSMLQIYHIYS